MIFGFGHNRSKIKSEHQAVLEEKYKAVTTDLERAEATVNFCEEYDYSQRSVIALLNRLGLYNGKLTSLMDAVTKTREYSVKFKQQICDQYLSKKPTYDTSKEITQNIAKINKISLSDVVGILNVEGVLISKMRASFGSVKLRDRFFTDDRVEKILAAQDIYKQGITENEKKRLAMVAVHNKVISSLHGISSIPSDAILLECKKGLKHIDQDMISKDVKYATPYSIRLWIEDANICYTYPFEADNIKRIKNMFHEDKEYLGSFYMNNGEIKNTFIDTFNGILPIFRINSDNLLMYSHEGDFYIKTDVSGSGGGSSYAKAIVGGVLLGSAAAIIASREEIKISTTSEEVDKRNTVLYYKYNDEIVDATFDSETYKIFKKLLPGKDSSAVDKLADSAPKTGDNKSSTNGSAVAEHDISQRLDKLKILLENGYITKYEYDEKRKKIIDQI